MECEFCDCTRSIKLPGKWLSGELDIPKEEINSNDNKFVDIGRLKLNRKKQHEGIESLRNLLHDGNDSVKTIFAGAAAISGLCNILDSKEARELLEGIGLEVLQLHKLQ
jgi:hypothetical protein